MIIGYCIGMVIMWVFLEAALKVGKDLDPSGYKQFADDAESPIILALMVLLWPITIMLFVYHRKGM